MSIRAFLYSRRAEAASEQTRWPSAILLVDNGPDKDTLAISQTSNKTKHSLSFLNNHHTAARVMDRPASSECGGQQSSGQTGNMESILFINLGHWTAWYHIVVTTFFQTKSTVEKQGEKHTQCKTFHSNNQSFWYAHLILLYCYTHTYTLVAFFSRDR